MWERTYRPPSDNSPTPGAEMSIYGRFFAAAYDHLMSRTERDGVRAHRQVLLAEAAGDVLEIGAGTGANLDLYDERVNSLTVTEPEAPMLRRLQRRAAQLRPRATLLRAPAEDLPFADGSFDVAVSTLVLCTVDDQPRAL